VILLVILVIIFGASRLTQFSGALGRSVREFRTAVQDEPKPAVPTAPPPPPVICASCETPNLATNKFCSSCGIALAVAGPEVPTPTTEGPALAPAAENICPSCATANPPGQAFCGQCGTRLIRAA